MQVAAAVHRAGGVIGLARTVQVLDASIRGLPAQSLLHS
jgi:glycolate oxidase iron-sulfur subunit